MKNTFKKITAIAAVSLLAVSQTAIDLWKVRDCH